MICSFVRQANSIRCVNLPWDPNIPHPQAKCQNRKSINNRHQYYSGKTEPTINYLPQLSGLEKPTSDVGKLSTHKSHFSHLVFCSFDLRIYFSFELSSDVGITKCRVRRTRVAGRVCIPSVDWHSNGQYRKRLRKANSIRFKVTSLSLPQFA